MTEMEQIVGDYIISTDKEKLSVAKIKGFLDQSYWAPGRTEAVIEKSVQSSDCYGIYCQGEQVGFARVVSDQATMYWIGDVFIDEKHRGKNLSKALIRLIVESEAYRGLRGILATSNAHGLYAQFGFVTVDGVYMRREPGR